jgi:hypothetical protein
MTCGEYVEIMSSQLNRNSDLSQEASACQKLLELTRGSSITVIFDGNQDAWDKFVFYVFERRFGGKYFCYELLILFK